MKTVIVLILLTLSTQAMAWGETYRNANGQVVGRSTTTSTGTTFYNSLGQQTGRAVTNSTGTTFYNALGQQTGTTKRK
jgi:hypothetical protein